MSLLTSFIVAVSLSMDAFSLALIYGTSNISKKNILLISFTVGIFHFFMPLLGFYFGDYLISLISFDPKILVSFIFIFLGVEMFLSIFKDEKIVMINSFISTLLFAFTVSLDSFSVGIGFGLSKSINYLSFIIFSIVSFLFTYTGMLLGNILSNKFGKYATLIGSITLIFLGIFNFF